MAIPTSIKTLLSGDVVEWARIEFKETWDAAASLKSICAFANDLDNWGGGYIIIGVQENNGKPVYPLKGVPTDKLDAYQKNIFGKVFMNNISELDMIKYGDWFSHCVAVPIMYLAELVIVTVIAGIVPMFIISRMKVAEVIKPVD